MNRAATSHVVNAKPLNEPHEGRVLDPVERVSELLFGLIMALTFTTTLSVATAGHEDVRTMLFGALGCNVAWGFVDAVFFLITVVAERHRNAAILREVRTSEDADRSRSLVGSALPPLIASVLRAEDLEFIRQQLKARPEPAQQFPVTGRDLWGALAVFLVVFASTLPVVAPFVLIPGAHLALRVSNGIALVLLFWSGVALGRYTGRPAFRLGVTMTLIGVVLVAVTIALGG